MSLRRSVGILGDHVVPSYWKSEYPVEMGMVHVSLPFSEQVILVSYSLPCKVFESVVVLPAQVNI